MGLAYWVVGPRRWAIKLGGAVRSYSINHRVVPSSGIAMKKGSASFKRSFFNSGACLLPNDSARKLYSENLFELMALVRRSFSASRC